MIEVDEYYENIEAVGVLGDNCLVVVSGWVVVMVGVARPD